MSPLDGKSIQRGLLVLTSSSIVVEEVEVQAADVRLHVRMAGNPDVQVALDRQQLLQGVDAPLEAALALFP